MEAWKEDTQELGYQYPHPGTNNQDATIGTYEEPATSQGTAVIAEAPIPSTGE